MVLSAPHCHGGLLALLVILNQKMLISRRKVRWKIMQSTLEQLENNRVLLKLAADPQEVADAFNQAYKKVVKRVTVPGFRKGRVPRFILEQQFGKEILYQDAVEILV